MKTEIGSQMWTMEERPKKEADHYELKGDKQEACLQQLGDKQGSTFVRSGRRQKTRRSLKAASLKMASLQRRSKGREGKGAEPMIAPINRQSRPLQDLLQHSRIIKHLTVLTPFFFFLQSKN